MTTSEKRWLRVALLIHERLQKAQVTPPASELPSLLWQHCQEIHRKSQKASRRGWYRAAKRLQTNLQDRLRCLQADLNAMERRLETSPNPGEIPPLSARDIAADLLALHEEFDAVNFDARSRWLAVTTEPVELEEVWLGPFEIGLDIDDVGQDGPPHYRVIALEPNPAAGNPGITHPHVQAERLCEGDARIAIRKAWQQGRLGDFFLLTAGLLRTYNASSPYVALEDWDAADCPDCGRSIAPDECILCRACDTSLCEGCFIPCSDCDGNFCFACVGPCAECEESHCTGCLKPCAKCPNLICSSCLTDNERCPDCDDQETNQKKEETAKPQTENRDGQAQTAVYAPRLGEAAVPAGLR